jgi:hypothetical protein
VIVPWLSANALHFKLTAAPVSSKEMAQDRVIQRHGV